MRPWRFGVNILDVSVPGDVLVTARRAAELGYDVVHVPDHVGLPAPFPTLVAAAHAGSLRVGTFVLNAAFHNPLLLARDVATTDVLTGGRLELGLGAGYVAEEFTAAGIPFGSPRERVDHLIRVVDVVYAALADAEFAPRPLQARVPLLIGGNGNRVLTLAAERADIVAFAGGSVDPADGAPRLLSGEAFADRVSFFDRVAGARSAEIERNLLVQVVHRTDDRQGAIAARAAEVAYLTEAELATAPSLLVGTVAEMVAAAQDLRERYGISYLTVLSPHLEEFGAVVAALRQT